MNDVRPDDDWPALSEREGNQRNSPPHVAQPTKQAPVPGGQQNPPPDLGGGAAGTTCTNTHEMRPGDMFCRECGSERVIQSVSTAGVLNADPTAPMDESLVMGNPSQSSRHPSGLPPQPESDESNVPRGRGRSRLPWVVAATVLIAAVVISTILLIASRPTVSAVSHVPGTTTVPSTAPTTVPSTTTPSTTTTAPSQTASGPQLTLFSPTPAGLESSVVAALTAGVVPGSSDLANGQPYGNDMSPAVVSQSSATCYSSTPSITAGAELICLVSAPSLTGPADFFVTITDGGHFSPRLISTNVPCGQLSPVEWQLLDQYGGGGC